MIPIQAVGSYLELDEQGHVIPIASPHRIQPAWRPLLEAVTGLYRQQLNERLRAVYVRGSIAKGQAVEHLSDFDSFCIVDRVVTLDAAACAAFRRAARQTYPFCTGIELTCVTEAEATRFPPGSVPGVWARIIKTQAVCVWGSDLSDRIRKLTLDDMVHYSRFLRYNLEDRLPIYIEEDRGNADDLAGLCSWTARLLLRVGYELVMHREGRWTNDLYLCYEALSRHHPERAALARQTLDLAINPRADVTTIQTMVADYSPWIYASIRQHLGISSDARY